MILQDVRQLVRSKLDDLQYDGNKVDSAINWFQFELFNNTRTALMEDDVNIDFLQGDYEISIPSQIQTITEILVVPTDTSITPYSIWKYRKEHGDFLQKFPNFMVANQANPREWSFYGRKIRLAAPASFGGKLFVEFIRRPVKAVGDSDLLEIPDNYEELAVIGGTARVMEMNEDYAEAAQERQNLEPLQTTFIRNEARGSQHTGPTIMRSNRRGRGGYED